MGLFDKLKKVFNVEGVHVELTAPASAMLQNANLPVTVTLTTKSAQHVKSISLKLVGVEQNQPAGAPVAGGTPRVFAEMSDTNSFAIQPGETKTVQLSLPLNLGDALASALPQNSVVQQMAGALQQVQTVASALDQHKYSYYVEAIANVDGATFDPSARVPITIINPGQMGTSFNIQL